MIRIRPYHLDDNALLRYREWGGRRAATVERHLESCDACRARNEELQRAVAEFSTYWQVRKAAVEAPPEPWPEIDLELRTAAETLPKSRRLASFVRRTAGRYPWLIGTVAVAAAAQFWIAGGFRLNRTPLPAPTAATRPTPHTGPVHRNEIAVPAAHPPSAARPAAHLEPTNLELQALSALHRIGADVGEPVELQRSANGLAVVVTAVDAAREAEIREALAPLPDVQLRFSHPGLQVLALEPRAADPQPEERLHGMRAKLDAQLGSAEREALEGRALEQSARLLASLHAIDDLDRRFPADSRARFTTADSELFHQLRSDHIAGAKQTLAGLQSVFDTIGFAWGVAPSKPVPADSMLENGRRLDEAIGILLGGAPSRKSPADLIGTAYASLASLRRQVEAME